MPIQQGCNTNLRPTGRIALSRRIHLPITTHRAMAIDLDALSKRSDEIWEESILPSLMEFISIPALSPHFEPKWAELE